MCCVRNIAMCHQESVTTGGTDAGHRIPMRLYALQATLKWFLLSYFRWWDSQPSRVCFRVELNWLFNVTINDISVIYVTAHRCAGRLKEKLDLRSGSQRHRHFVGFFNVPVQALIRDQPFYKVILTQRSN